MVDLRHIIKTGSWASVLVSLDRESHFKIASPLMCHLKSGTRPRQLGG